MFVSLCSELREMIIEQKCSLLIGCSTLCYLVRRRLAENLERESEGSEGEGVKERERKRERLRERYERE